MRCNCGRVVISRDIIKPGIRQLLNGDAFLSQVILIENGMQILYFSKGNMAAVVTRRALASNFITLIMCTAATFGVASPLHV